MEAAQQKGRSRSSQRLLAFEEERLSVHQLGCFQPGGICFCPPLQASQGLSPSRHLWTPVAKQRCPQRKQVLFKSFVLCECVHASGRPLFDSHIPLPAGKARLCPPLGARLERVALGSWHPTGVFCPSTSALCDPARREEGERPPQPAFDGAQIPTGALPIQAGEKLSNLKIIFMGPNGILIKM